MAGLSLCMIVRNEERGLGQCLGSVAQYVDEIIIVDTGSTDRTKEIAKSFGAKVFDFNQETNPEAFYLDDENSGTIPPWTGRWQFADFGAARNFSFDKATQKYLLWVDADDVVMGAENLRDIVAEMEKDSLNVISAKYDYHTDDKGNVTTVLWRERVIRRGVGIRWVQPVHEVLSPISMQRHTDKMKIVHHRHKVGTPQVPNRNYKILQRLYARTKNNIDPRTLFYLGNEARFIDPGKAVEYFTEYLRLSGWDEERGIARNLLGQIFEDKGDYVAAFNHYAGAAADHPINADGWFGLARVAYFREDWDKCVRYTEAGFEVGNVELVIMTNPLDRTLRPHIFYNMALNRLGRVKDAIASCEAGLKVDPTNKDLLHNKKLYEDFIAGVNQPKSPAPGDGPTVFRLNEDIEEPPKDLDVDIVAALATQVWKQIIKTREHYKIPGFLASLPHTMDAHPQIVEIRRRSDAVLGSRTGHALAPPTPEITTTPGTQGLVWKPYHRPPNYPRGVTSADLVEAVVTPHSQAWGIPESFNPDDLPINMTTRQLQALVGAVWVEYIAQDEILSAIKFLEYAPYRVRHSVVTEELLRRTRKMIAWISDESEYDKGNTPTKSVTDLSPLGREMFPVSRTTVTTIPGAGGDRYQWFTDRMRAGASIVDFGCIDGEMTNRWGLAGFKVVGLDVSTESVRIANAAAVREQTGAIHHRTYFKDALQYVPAESFDYAVSGDVYEHLMDPVNDLLIPARKLVKPTGQFLMATPHGSWYRGTFNAAYHPWLWGEEGETWNTPNRNRAHVVAPTVWTVADNFRKAGFYVNDCVVVTNGRWRDVPGQGNIFAQGFPTPPKGYEKGKDIVFYLGAALAPWTPHTADVFGQGGSEISAIHMSKRLAAAGHRVRVYSDCGEWGEGIYDGVEYRHSEKFHDLKCDVLIVSRQADALDARLNVEAKIRLLWTHDVVPKGFTHELSLRADKILALSNWHKRNIETVYPFLAPGHVRVTRNGIDPDRFRFRSDRKPHRAVYSSSPDRGLIALLQMWPKIKQRVPDAELHIFYGFENWRKSAVNDLGQLKLIGEIENKIKDLAPLGVVTRGRVPQHELAQEFLQAGAWLYPTWFTETSCITAMEAQAAGLACVTSPIAALTETLGDRGTMVSGDWLAEDYQRSFIEAAVRALSGMKQEHREELSAFAKMNFDYAPLVAEWERMFDELLAEVPSISAFKEHK